MFVNNEIEWNIHDKKKIYFRNGKWAESTEKKEAKRLNICTDAYLFPSK